MLYTGEKTKNISFPLGGIGTGCIGLAGNGEIKDWEIFNRPNKCSRNGYSHFAIKAYCKDKSIVKILHGDTNENLIGSVSSIQGYYGFGQGPRANSLAGFPHFRKVSFEGTFPIANLTFSDEDFPAVIKMCAFNPFIPHDEFNSSLPAAFFEFEIENTTDDTVRFALGCTVCNPSESSINETVYDSERACGLLLKSASRNKNEIDYSDLCILTEKGDNDIQEYWYRGKWQDDCTTYWKNISELDRMPERSYSEPSKKDHGTVVSYADIPSRGKAKLRYVISWNSPTAYNYWNSQKDPSEARWLNYYASKFKNSFESAKYALKSFGQLYERTVLFKDTLCESSLPLAVKEAISANLSVIKTPTALRLEDGSFWGWEGCCENIGSCYGSCQHVWNYAYVMPYLFPSLERSMREINLKYALMDDGQTSFRVDLPLKREMSTKRACVDGQMGEVIKCYREWKFSGDDEWLKKHSEGIFKMLEYAWSKENPDKWDANMDGVLEGRQHHTLDLEIFGPSSWLEGFYLLALDCAAEMARFLGESEREKLYSRLYQSGKKWMNEHLYNGSYFCQSIDLLDKSILDNFGCADFYWHEEAKEIKFQVANGCAIDQMIADWHSALLGMRSVFDSEKKRTALRSLYKYNFKPSMRDVANMWRNFALNDEAGTVICSYPDAKNSPAIPLSYCDETMTGFEYAIAGLMIYEGYRDEGENIVKAIRDRYDGNKRNPWNEIECGSNYARSMASYALLPIYSGFTADMTKKHISFNPIDKNGKYLFSVCESWGCADFGNGQCLISVFEKPLTLSSISIPHGEKISSVTVDGDEIDFKFSNGRIIVEKITITKELCLK